MRDIIFLCRAEKFLFYPTSCPSLLVEKRLLAAKLFSNGVKDLVNLKVLPKHFVHFDKSCSRESMSIFVHSGEIVCVSGGTECSFFGKFVVLCFLVTSVLRFALLPYYRRYARKEGARKLAQ